MLTSCGHQHGDGNRTRRVEITCILSKRIGHVVYRQKVGTLARIYLCFLTRTTRPIVGTLSPHLLHMVELFPTGWSKASLYPTGVSQVSLSLGAGLDITRADERRCLFVTASDLSIA